MAEEPSHPYDRSTGELHDREHSRIFGVGEMADRTRALDWSQTPVGPITQWSDALLITVNTMLSSRHPMFLWWGDELIQFYNDAYRPSIREDKHPNALGQRGADCWPEIWHIIGPQIAAVMTQGQASWHENQLVPIFRNGELEDVYWTYGYSPVRDSAGTIQGTLVVCTETTASVLAGRTLQQERERLADLFQQAPAFFASLRGPDHIFEIANPLYQTLIGHRDVLGKTVREAVPEAEQQGFIALLDRVYQSGEPFVGRSSPIQLVRSVSGPMEIRYLDFVYQPMRDTEGAISGVIVLGVDVTENKRAERALMQSEKLAAVGRLAASIAHEINNPLEAVMNLLYLARATAERPDVKQYLLSAEVELQRASVVTNQTLRFYRQTTSPRQASARELIEATLALYQGRFFTSRIQVERRERALSTISCLDSEIRHVLSNLISNAIDVMKHRGGRLLIRSRDAIDWTTERSGIAFTIADTGAGMPSDILSQIFEPFFTTKGMSGTGLGLWLSREIVERHRGSIKVRSSTAPDRAGTVFVLFLPQSDAQPAAESCETPRF